MARVRSRNRGRLRLVADLGATNARFALQHGHRPPFRVAVLAVRDFPGPAAAIRHYLDRHAAPFAPREGRLAVAAPVDGDRVDFINHPWSFKVSALKRAFGFRRLAVVNDFEAVAGAVPFLHRRDLFKVGGGRPRAGAPKIVLGPGTGLGLGALAFTAQGWQTVATEGGHVTMAAANVREAEVLAALGRRFGHVSAERVLSGPGLVNLFSAIAELAGVAPPRATPEGIMRRALARESEFCREAADLFFSMLGTFASNAALTFGARGGVYIAGGILPEARASLAASRFRNRFESKGRYASYLAAIPTYVVTRPVPAFLGLAHLDPSPGPARRIHP
ncbi:MAG: glucokinase [Alphaproteobacteria bacterium]